MAHALGFGFCWISLSLFLAAMPVFGRTKLQRANRLPITSAQKKERRSIVVTGIVSACCGTLVAYFHADGSNLIPTMLLALVAAAVVATVMLLPRVFGVDGRQTQDRPPVTGYRAKPPADRDGPHT
jgi:cobalamin synthase